MYALRPVRLYSFFFSSVVLNNALRLESKSHTSHSHWGRSSRHLGFLNLGSFVQYSGNPSRRLGSLSLQRILKNLPLKPLYDCWKRVSKTLPTAPLKLTHGLRPGRLASKKYRNTSTDGRWPKWWHKMEKLQINAWLFGCSWARVMLISVRRALSKLGKGR